MPHIQSHTGALMSGDLRRRVLTALTQAFLIGGAALFIVVTGRYWGGAARGDLSVVQVVAGSAATLGGLGLTDVYVYARYRYPVDDMMSWALRSGLWVALAGTIAAVAIWVCGVPLRVAIVVPPAAVLLQLNRVSATLRLSEDRFGGFDAIRGLPILGPLLLATAVAYSVGASGARIEVVYLVALAAIALPVFVVDAARTKSHPRVSMPRELLGLARHSVVWNLVQLGLARVDVLLLYLMASRLDAGVYASAIALSEAAGFASVAHSYFAQRRGAAGLEPTRRADVLVTVLALGALGLLVQSVVPTLLGRDFADLGHLYWLYAPASVGLALLRPALSFRFGANDVSRAMPLVLGGFAFCLIGDLAVIPFFGAAGAAIVSSIAYPATYVVLRVRRLT